MKKYRRMTYTDRLKIEKLFNAGLTYRQISKETGFSVSSLHYEIKRGKYVHRNHDWMETVKYSAAIAEDDAEWKATSRGASIKLGNRHDYAHEVARRLRLGQSPDVIVGIFRKLGLWTVSTPTLYRYIDKGYIPNISNKDLPEKSKKKRRPYRKVRAAKAPRGESIEQRPEIINDRTTLGHWEMDTVIGKAKGKGQAILVLTERKTRFEIIYKLASKTASAVVHALSKITKAYPQGTFRTITVDNGSEFADYDGIKSHTGEVYYCHPYSSYERGSNENANRLIRRYLPKGQSLEHVTQVQCDAIANAINQMTRKILNYSTAAEQFGKWQAELFKKI